MYNTTYTFNLNFSEKTALYPNIFRLVFGFITHFFIPGSVERTGCSWKNMSNQIRIVAVHHKRVKNAKISFFARYFRTATNMADL